MRGTRKLAVAIMLALAGSSGMAFAQSAPNDQTTNPEQANTTAGQPGDATGPATLPILDWAVGLGYEHTDNIGRTSIDPTSQDVLKPTLNFTYRQQGSRLQAQATGILQYTDYLQGYYGNDIFGQLSGQMNWVIAPQRLNFDIEDYASVQPVNTRLSNAPSNQQQVNIFVAGPTLTFRMGGTLQGEADLRYINTSASKTKDFNSQRGMGAFRVIRNISSTDTLSGNFEATHVDFDNTDPLANANRYTEYNAYLRYQRVLARVNFNLAVGASRIDFGQGGESHSGSLVRASVTWRATNRSALTAGATDQITDSTSNLAQPADLSMVNLTNPNIQIGNSVISPAVFRDRGLSLGYLYQGTRLNLTLASYYTRLRQLNGDGLSRDAYGVVAGVTYLIQPLLTLGINANYQVTKYESDDNRDRNPSYSVFLSRQLTPHWSWSVSFNHNSRLASVPGFGYQENSLLAILYFRR